MLLVAPNGSMAGGIVLFSMVFVLASMVAISGVSDTAATPTMPENQPSVTTTTPIGSNMAVERSVISLYVPEDNPLPWAYVEGTVSNPVPDYPVIIQIYDDNGSPVPGNSAGAVHFAQTEVAPDGSYEYRFRVLDSQTRVFTGDYTVKIFKVVYVGDDDVNSGVRSA